MGGLEGPPNPPEGREHDAGTRRWSRLEYERLELFVAVTSLIPTGTPKSGGSAARRRSAAVARRASRNAESRTSVTIAFTSGFTAAIRERMSCMTSSGEALRAR
jgi:hypothetical protein